MVGPPADLGPIQDLPAAVPQGISAEPAMIGIFARLGASPTVPISTSPKETVISYVVIGYICKIRILET